MSEQEQHPTVDDVKKFWEENPLFTGEFSGEVGSKSYFDRHREVYLADCFAGAMDERIFPAVDRGKSVLDLGCGPGFWIKEFWDRGFQNLNAADLTDAALELAKKRCQIFDVSCEFSTQNAEETTFPDNTFDHVNCQGVIHHTPNTEQCVAEFARVLKPGGTVCASIYYQNILLRNWNVLQKVIRPFAKSGAGGLSGRGREGMAQLSSAEEIVRHYDGSGNPIGKAYTTAMTKALFEPYFEVTDVFYHFFPARSLPLTIPSPLHRFLDRKLPFMIYIKGTVR